ncbi:kinesin light chain 2 [Fusarium longipes]|uniref:Kinesin light chain 2 n=1 Tax=Fusarium longipes TaxID=694270 RepID=A0A395RZY4_9HYPO|nr:kinesin light chain 2 [Fusarium longipes]
MSFQPIFPDLPGLSPVEQQSGAFTYERYDASQSIDELGSRNVVSAQLTAGQPTISHLRSFPHQHPISAPHGTTPLHDETVPAETSMGPPPKRRKRKAPTLRAKDWEPYKARVLELHITKKLPLKEVKTIIEEEFGFNAELRQYRTRLTQWGKDKNVKPAEMAAIVRKRQQRRFDNGDKGEQAFTVRGITVESHKIDRWMARNGVSQTSLYATSPAASTPSAVSCHTISKHGSVISSPTNSTRSLNFSPGNTTSMIMSPAAASAATPTFSVREMSETHSIASTESIPVPTYQPLPTLPSMFQSTASDPVDHDQVPRRFRQDAEERVRKKLLEAEESLGPSHRHALNLRIELGSILRSQGRYKFAGETDRRAIEDCRNEDSNTTSMFDAMDFLVGVLRNRRAYDEAHVLQKRVFESKVTMGEEHSSTIDSMINLVYSYGYIDKVEGAEALCVGALERTYA